MVSFVVADRSNNRVLKLREGCSEGIVIAGGAGESSTLGQLRRPRGIAVTHSGEILVTDHNNHRVLKLKDASSEGSVVAGGQGSSPSQLQCPSGIALLPSGAILVADNFNHRVLKLREQSTEAIVVAGSNGQGSALDQLHYPSGIAVLPSGAFLVTDLYNHRVLKFNEGSTVGIVVAGGNGQGSSPSQLHQPTGIAVLPSGSFLVTDHYNHRVLKFSEGNSEGVLVAGGNGKGSALGQLHCPSGVAVLPSGAFLVADFGNHRVLKFCEGRREGTVVAGGNGKGSALCQLCYPTGIAVLPYDDVAPPLACGPASAARAGGYRSSSTSRLDTPIKVKEATPERPPTFQIHRGSSPSGDDSDGFVKPMKAARDYIGKTCIEKGVTHIATVALHFSFQGVGNALYRKCTDRVTLPDLARSFRDLLASELGMETGHGNWKRVALDLVRKTFSIDPVLSCYMSLEEVKFPGEPPGENLRVMELSIRPRKVPTCHDDASYDWVSPVDLGDPIIFFHPFNPENPDSLCFLWGSPEEYIYPLEERLAQAIADGFRNLIHNMPKRHDEDDDMLDEDFIEQFGDLIGQAVARCTIDTPTMPS